MRRPIRLAFLAALVLGAIFGLHRIVDPDLFQQVAVGRALLADPSAIGRSDYHHTVPVRDYVADKWLASVAAAGFDRLGGEHGLMLYQLLLTTLVAGCAFALLLVEGASPPVALAGAGLALAACGFRLEPRPDTLSLALVAALLALLRSRVGFRRLLWIVPVLFALWVNLHGYFVVGLLVLLAATVTSASGEELRRRLALLGLALLACCAHPQGVRALAWPIRQLWMLHEHSYLREAILEFQPGTALLRDAGTGRWLLLGATALAALLLDLAPAGRRPGVRAEAGLLFAMPWIVLPPPGLGPWPYRLTFALLIAASFEVGAALRERRRLEPLLLAGFTLLAAPMIRNLSLLPFAALALLAPVWGKASGRLVAAAPTVAAAVCVLVAWARLADRLPPGSDRSPGWTGWGIERSVFPAGAADFIDRAGLPGPLLNHFDNGGYLLYRFHPGRRVFISGNTSMYPPEFFREFHRRVIGRDADLQDLESRYGVRLAVLDHASPETSILVGKLMRSDSWLLVYLDRSAAVFVRAAASSRETIERLRVDVGGRIERLLEEPEDRSPLPSWMLPRRRIYPALNLGLFLRSAGRPDLALRLADRMWSSGPDARLATFTATAAEETGALSLAIPRLEWAVARDRGGAAARAWLSRALYVRALRSLERDRAVSARNDLERAHALTPGEPGPLVAVARLEAESGDESAARKALARALELSPDGRVFRTAAADPLLAPLLPSGPARSYDELN